MLFQTVAIDIDCFDCLFIIFHHLAHSCCGNAFQAQQWSTIGLRVNLLDYQNSIFKARRLSWHQTNSVKALKAVVSQIIKLQWSL